MGVSSVNVTAGYLAEFMRRSQLYFFHFTDVRNLDGIKEKGILPTAELNWGGHDFVSGGDRESLLVDERKGFDRYVHLCFWNQHPMEYRAKLAGRISRSVFLRVDPEVILTPGTLVSDRVSTANDAIVEPADVMLPKLDLFPIYNRMNWKESEIKRRVDATRKYEILVPSVIRPNQIVGI